MLQRSGRAGVDGRRGCRRSCRMCAGVVVIVGLARLAELLLGWPHGVSELLFPEAPSTDNPARYGAANGLELFLTGCALVLTDRVQGIWAFEGMALLVRVIRLIGLNRYL